MQGKCKPIKECVNRACACIIQVGSASPRRNKHTPCKMKRSEKLNAQPKSSHEVKRQMRWRAKWGFALSRLRKHPLSRYCQTALLSNFNSRKRVFFFAQASPFLVGVISNKTKCCIFRRVLVLI